MPDEKHIVSFVNRKKLFAFENLKIAFTIFRVTGEIRGLQDSCNPLSDDTQRINPWLQECKEFVQFTGRNTFHLIFLHKHFLFPNKIHSFVINEKGIDYESY